LGSPSLNDDGFTFWFDSPSLNDDGFIFSFFCLSLNNDGFTFWFGSPLLNDIAGYSPTLRVGMFTENENCVTKEPP
jgi:hypothetical protein